MTITKSTLNTPFFVPGFRWLHLLGMTDALLISEQWPQTDRWLADYFKQHSSFGRRDRAFYRDAVFLLCRQAAAVCHLEASFQGGDSHNYRSVWTKLQQMGALAIWKWLVLLNDPELRLPREIESISDESAIVKQEQDVLTYLKLGWLPDWNPAMDLRKERSRWSDSDVGAFKEMQVIRPPLWLRGLPGEGEEVAARLTAEGFDVLMRDRDALALSGEKSIYGSSMWKSGKLEIQDWASQMIVRDLVALPGMDVWDACAGGGGKTMALAAAMGNHGTLVASDIRGFKLKEVQSRAARQGWTNILTVSWDASGQLPERMSGKGGFDRVLVDAPCSGSGTWRRNPDARWRLNEGALSKFNALQNKVLRAAAPAVKRGGLLAYATCSWLVEENEAIVEAFLNDHNEFKLVTQKVHGAPNQDSDTMFVATMERQ